jgi:hypothetical protein
MADRSLTVTDEENKAANWQQVWFDQVRLATEKVRTFVPAGDGVTVQHWIAAIVHAFSKSLPWSFDLQAFKIAMHHTAALCLIACHWADEVMERRAATRAIIAMQAGEENLQGALDDAAITAEKTAAANNDPLNLNPFPFVEK